MNIYLHLCSVKFMTEATSNRSIKRGGDSFKVELISKLYRVYFQEMIAVNSPSAL